MARAHSALAALSLLALPALAGTQTVPVSPFTEIETRGAMHVVYKAGPETSVVIETDGDDFSDADVSVSGGKLVIARVSADKTRLLSRSPRISVSNEGRRVEVNGKRVPSYTVHVTSPELSAIRVSRRSWAEATGLDAGRFEADASSDGRLTLAGRAQAGKLSASSAAAIRATGFEVGALTANASSASKLEATVSGTGDTALTASSAAEMSVRSLQPASFSASASSGSDMKLSGACSAIRISASSGADVKASQLNCTNASANASSGATVRAHALTAGDGNASSGGSVYFAGGARQQEVRQSSGGVVRFTD